MTTPFTNLGYTISGLNGDLDALRARIGTGSSGFVYDVRNYGAKATYVSSSSVGFDNRAAFQSAISAAATAGGGRVYVPSGRYWMSGGVFLQSKGIHVVGDGRIATSIFYEPTSATNEALFELNSSDLVQTTLVDCSVREFSIFGFGIDEAPGVPRHKKTAVRFVCTSECAMENVTVAKFYTDTTLYASEGGSIGLEHKGKELTFLNQCTLVTDRPIRFDINPKEPSVQIDSDACHIRSLYAVMPIGGVEAAVWIAPKAIIRAFKMDGNNIVAGGKHGIYWDDPAGGAGTSDAVFFTIEDLRTEQQNHDATGYTVFLSRRGAGKLYNVTLKRINCNIVSTGISLEGCISNVLENCAYYRFTDQDTSPLALELKGYCDLTSLNDFFVPNVSVTSLISIAATSPLNSVKNSTGGTVSSQVPQQVNYGQ